MIFSQSSTWLGLRLYYYFPSFHSRILSGLNLLNQYELDFVLVDKDNTVYGVEVKTKDGSPESLRIFIDRHLIDRGIVAKTARGGHGEKFDTIPVFTVGCRFPYIQE